MCNEFLYYEFQVLTNHANYLMILGILYYYIILWNYLMRCNTCNFPSYALRITPVPHKDLHTFQALFLHVSDT